jgi:hypothetical protein
MNLLRSLRWSKTNTNVLTYFTYLPLRSGVMVKGQKPASEALELRFIELGPQPWQLGRYKHGKQNRIHRKTAKLPAALCPSFL